MVKPKVNKITSTNRFFLNHFLFCPFYFNIVSHHDLTTNNLCRSASVFSWIVNYKWVITRGIYKTRLGLLLLERFSKYMVWLISFWKFLRCQDGGMMKQRDQETADDRRNFTLYTYTIPIIRVIIKHHNTVYQVSLCCRLLSKRYIGSNILSQNLGGKA